MTERLETSEWWAANGTLDGSLGTFLVSINPSTPESLSQEVAMRRLNDAVLRTHRGSVRLNTIQLAWEGLEECVEDIIQRRDECYTRLSPDVFFFED